MDKKNNEEFFSVLCESRSGFSYSIYLYNQPITSDYDISELLDCFRCASEYDEINLYLNNPGGCSNTARQIVNAMDDCECTITAIADGAVHSSAALIFLAADEHVIKRNSDFLFHCTHIETFEGGYEKISDAKSEADFINDQDKEFYEHYVQGFLTKKEIEELLDGTDFRLNAQQAEERLAKFRKHKKKTT
jgi:ATP-dependent protease ClpP protease subunit